MPAITQEYKGSSGRLQRRKWVDACVNEGLCFEDVVSLYKAAYPKAKSFKALQKTYDCSNTTLSLGTGEQANRGVDPLAGAEPVQQLFKASGEANPGSNKIQAAEGLVANANPGASKLHSAKVAKTGAKPGSSKTQKPKRVRVKVQCEDGPKNYFITKDDLQKRLKGKHSLEDLLDYLKRTPDFCVHYYKNKECLKRDRGIEGWVRKLEKRYRPAPVIVEQMPQDGTGFVPGIMAFEPKRKSAETVAPVKEDKKERKRKHKRKRKASVRNAEEPAAPVHNKETIEACLRFNDERVWYDIPVDYIEKRLLKKGGDVTIAQLKSFVKKYNKYEARFDCNVDGIKSGSHAKNWVDKARVAILGEYEESKDAEDTEIKCKAATAEGEQVHFIKIKHLLRRMPAASDITASDILDTVLIDRRTVQVDLTIFENPTTGDLKRAVASIIYLRMEDLRIARGIEDPEPVREACNRPNPVPERSDNYVPQCIARDDEPAPLMLEAWPKTDKREAPKQGQLCNLGKATTLPMSLETQVPPESPIENSENLPESVVSQEIVESQSDIYLTPPQTPNNCYAAHLRETGADIPANFDHYERERLLYEEAPIDPVKDRDAYLARARQAVLDDSDLDSDNFSEPEPEPEPEPEAPAPIAQVEYAEPVYEPDAAPDTPMVFRRRDLNYFIDNGREPGDWPCRDLSPNDLLRDYLYPPDDEPLPGAVRRRLFRPMQYTIDSPGPDAREKVYYEDMLRESLAYERDEEYYSAYDDSDNESESGYNSEHGTEAPRGGLRGGDSHSAMGIGGGPEACSAGVPEIGQLCNLGKATTLPMSLETQVPPESPIEISENVPESAVSQDIVESQATQPRAFDLLSDEALEAVESQAGDIEECKARRNLYCAMEEAAPATGFKDEPLERRHGQPERIVTPKRKAVARETLSPCGRYVPSMGNITSPSAYVSDDCLTPPDRFKREQQIYKGLTPPPPKDNKINKYKKGVYRNKPIMPNIVGNPVTDAVRRERLEALDFIQETVDMCNRKGKCTDWANVEKDRLYNKWAREDAAVERAREEDYNEWRLENNYLRRPSRDMLQTPPYNKREVYHPVSPDSAYKAPPTPKATPPAYNDEFGEVEVGEDVPPGMGPFEHQRALRNKYKPKWRKVRPAPPTPKATPPTPTPISPEIPKCAQLCNLDKGTTLPMSLETKTPTEAPIKISEDLPEGGAPKAQPYAQPPRSLPLPRVSDSPGFGVSASLPRVSDSPGFGVSASLPRVSDSPGFGVAASLPRVSDTPGFGVAASLPRVYVAPPVSSGSQSPQAVSPRCTPRESVSQNGTLGSTPRRAGSAPVSPKQDPASPTVSEYSSGSDTTDSDVELDGFDDTVSVPSPKYTMARFAQLETEVSGDEVSADEADDEPTAEDIEFICADDEVEYQSGADADDEVPRAALYNMAKVGAYTGELPEIDSPVKDDNSGSSDTEYEEMSFTDALAAVQSQEVDKQPCRYCGEVAVKYLPQFRVKACMKCGEISGGLRGGANNNPDDGLDTRVKDFLIRARNRLELQALDQEDQKDIRARLDEEGPVDLTDEERALKDLPLHVRLDFVDEEEEEFQIEQARTRAAAIEQGLIPADESDVALNKNLRPKQAVDMDLATDVVEIAEQVNLVGDQFVKDDVVQVLSKVDPAILNKGDTLLDVVKKGRKKYKNVDKNKMAVYSLLKSSMQTAVLDVTFRFGNTGRIIEKTVLVSGEVDPDAFTYGLGEELMQEELNTLYPDREIQIIQTTIRRRRSTNLADIKLFGTMLRDSFLEAMGNETVVQGVCVWSYIANRINKRNESAKAIRYKAVSAQHVFEEARAMISDVSDLAKKVRTGMDDCTFTVEHESELYRAVETLGMLKDKEMKKLRKRIGISRLLYPHKSVKELVLQWEYLNEHFVETGDKYEGVPGTIAVLVNYAISKGNINIKVIEPLGFRTYVEAKADKRRSINLVFVLRDKHLYPVDPELLGQFMEQLDTSDIMDIVSTAKNCRRIVNNPTIINPSECDDLEFNSPVVVESDDIDAMRLMVKVMHDTGCVVDDAFFGKGGCVQGFTHPVTREPIFFGKDQNIVRKICQVENSDDIQQNSFIYRGQAMTGVVRALFEKYIGKVYEIPVDDIATEVLLEYTPRAFIQGEGTEGAPTVDINKCYTSTLCNDDCKVLVPEPGQSLRKFTGGDISEDKMYCIDSFMLGNIYCGRCLLNGGHLKKLKEVLGNLIVVTHELLCTRYMDIEPIKVFLKMIRMKYPDEYKTIGNTMIGMFNQRTYTQSKCIFVQEAEFADALANYYTHQVISEIDECSCVVKDIGSLVPELDQEMFCVQLSKKSDRDVFKGYLYTHVMSNYFVSMCKTIKELNKIGKVVGISTDEFYMDKLPNAQEIENMDIPYKLSRKSGIGIHRQCYNARRLYKEKDWRYISKLEDVPQDGSVYIGGLAGTGKSTYVIDNLAQQTGHWSFTDPSDKLYIVAGPTHKNKIGLHKKFKEASKRTQYQHTDRVEFMTVASLVARLDNDETLSSVKGKMGLDLDTKIILLIDEVSMITYAQLYAIYKTGFPIICFGDFGQIPPVESKALAPLEFNETFMSMCSYTRLDKAPVLGKCRAATQETLDFQIKFRETGRIEPGVLTRPININDDMHISYTNEKVDKISTQKGLTFDKLKAGDTVMFRPESKQIKKYADKGIFNGAIYTIDTIDRKQNGTYVKAMDEEGNVIDVGRVTSKFMKTSKSITSHKVQGATIECNYSIHQSNIMSRKMMYVAITRARDIKQIGSDLIHGWYRPEEQEMLEVRPAPVNFVKVIVHPRATFPQCFAYMKDHERPLEYVNKIKRDIPDDLPAHFYDKCKGVDMVDSLETYMRKRNKWTETLKLMVPHRTVIDKSVCKLFINMFKVKEMDVQATTEEQFEEVYGKVIYAHETDFVRYTVESTQGFKVGWFKSVHCREVSDIIKQEIDTIVEANGRFEYTKRWKLIRPEQKMITHKNLDTVKQRVEEYVKRAFMKTETYADVPLVNGKIPSNIPRTKINMYQRMVAEQIMNYSFDKDVGMHVKVNSGLNRTNKYEMVDLEKLIELKEVDWNTVYPNDAKKAESVQRSLDLMYNSVDRNKGMLKVEYIKAHGDRERYGRVYARNSCSLGALSKKARHSIAKDVYDDIDIDNCHPVLLNQLTGEQYPSLGYYVSHREESLAEVMQALGCSRDDAKRLYIIGLYGGSLDIHVRELNKTLDDAPNRLVGFYEEMTEIVDKVCDANPETFNTVKRSMPGKEDHDIKVSTLSKLLQEIENRILFVMDKFFELQDGYLNKHSVLCFDGIMVSKKFRADDATLRQLQQRILKATGYDVCLSFKEMNQGY